MLGKYKIFVNSVCYRLRFVSRLVFTCVYLEEKIITEITFIINFNNLNIHKGPWRGVLFVNYFLIVDRNIKPILRHDLNAMC